MPAIATKKKTDVTVVKNLKDYSEEPAFQKKAEKARGFLKKHGLPKVFSKKK